jgi:Xaa-Pro aminopeptidase
MMDAAPSSLGLSPLDLLRAELRRRGLDGFVVPRADEHQGEYVPASAKRLAFLSGFTGSAGVAIVLPEAAAVFSDGRYTLQMREEVDTARFETRHITETPPHEWLQRNLKGGQRIGYDPWLHIPDEVKRLEDAARAAGGALVACDDNPVDAVWARRPAPPAAPAEVYPAELSGRVSLDKRREVAAQLERDGEDAAVLTLPDSIAWLLNIRGRDLPGTPVVLSFAVVRRDARVEWFVDAAKADAALRAHLGEGVILRSRGEFRSALCEMGAKRLTVRVDPASVPAAAVDLLKATGARVSRGLDPCLMPKACKNAVELDGFRRAHRRDAVAMARFLAWFDRSALGLDEKAVANRLLDFRKEQEGFVCPSFPTIAGAGPNGALVHYHVRAKTARILEEGQLLLLDSGAHFRDGTTDVTRTLVLGRAGEDQRRHFTRVLQGHIDLAMAVFPPGTTGSQLDALARRPLWAEGLDYDHGTGHGVGAYLSVHEGPQRISKVPSAVPLKPGMVLSNEPGYYRAGEYGIRIENLQAVRAVEGGERPMLGFEILTLVPIDRRLIEARMLTPEQRDWLNAYHERVAEVVGPMLDAETAIWLDAATRPL